MERAPQILSADTLVGDSVKNPQGESLGDLKAIMLDLENGKVAYAVLSFGGILNMGDKLFAVPWSALRVDGENKCLVLDASKDRLKDAPGFDKDHWPDFADTTFAQKISGYYQRK